MSPVATIEKLKTFDTFEVKGEEFVVLKKEYLEEIAILIKSFIVGEKTLRENSTRSFAQFIKTFSRKRNEN